MSIKEEFRKLRDLVPLLAGIVGGGIAMLVSKVLDLIASGYSGHGYQLEFPDKVVTTVFILLMVVILLISRRRWREVIKLAEANDRRLSDLDARLDMLLGELKR